ncbi:MAG: DUF438 domain-containing protein [Nitrospirae bacterium]|nr:DUF438 domain-containing protein [Nitrospirota bacterium]
MELSSRTKIAALLSQYPFIKDYLTKLNTNFKALDNPLMRNTLGRMATLNQAALVGGVDLDALMQGIAGEIRKMTNEIISIKSDETSPENREEILKGIIRDIHKGVDIGILKKRFLELIKDVSPYEIAQMEQKLISEGMPEQEVKQLCSVHVEVFKESLEKKTLPGLPVGHPVHTLMLENRHTESITQELEGLKDKAGLPHLIEKLSPIEKHYARKENQLFPILETKGITGPSKVMWALHDDIRDMLRHVKAGAVDKTVKDLEIKTLITMINDMIYKEEHILYPMALETLSDEDWFKVKKGEEEIGFAWLDKVDEWVPSGMSGLALAEEKVGSINLDTGQITPEQVNLLLTHLPVDVSFVNENDEVVYYSATQDRIFPRSPGIIGRKVQNCHPPRSVDIVEKILEAFKRGEKDDADFWIQMRGRFILIRYFAVRDTKGKYRGTLEVSQDVTEIRALTGERRLLSWD